jgi:hypothetical protein
VSKQKKIAMKNKIQLIILTIMFSYQFSYGQNNEQIEFKSDDLIGIWIPKYNRENDNLTFEKKTTTEYKYGLSVEILKNGEFHNRYSAPCGNDTMLRTQNYKGKWSLNTDEWIISTSEPIIQKGTNYKIIELKSDKLILAEIKPE